ncbi:hypothetical protein [uncultured Pseudoalteromonas sp.]|uniref:hypothetical protein n=1 Tax=uncultured Pseudoalteromonas sp. TaxID=114053 RepID=UPI0025916F31|nr:hypothetical protein [uncultured Pseudoalteromonas sp.]
MKNLMIISVAITTLLAGCGNEASEIDKIESYLLTVHNETKGKTLKYSEKDENNKIAFKYANDGYIELTSRSNDVEITNILFNRGNCKMESKNLTRALKERGSFKIAFGTKIPIRFYCIGSDLIEVTVATEFGDFVYDIE